MSSLHQERHESSLHREPDTPRDVEYDGLDHEEYGDPLVVGIVEVGAVKCCPPGAVTLRSGHESGLTEEFSAESEIVRMLSISRLNILVEDVRTVNNFLQP